MISLITSRRRFIAATAAGASALASITDALAQATPEAPKQADFLFVQSAKGLAFDKSSNKLTLTGVSPVTIFFTDRPERIAGNMKTAAFIPFWSEGKDSFKSNPPNADVSILEGKELRQVVVELMDPVLSGDNLSYTVKVLQGEMPATGSDVSVFIDIIGRPLTPFSYAGVARRAYRRAYWR
ncbi:MAG: hypothetical protein AB7S93_23695 [Xanthobacteraceae bacterium]